MTITQTGIKKDVQGVYIVKDPDSQIVYTVDWSSWLASGDTIATSTFSITSDTVPAGAANLTVVSSGITTADTYTYVEVSGGSDGHVYTVKNTVTTTNSITDVRRFRVKVAKRYL